MRRLSVIALALIFVALSSQRSRGQEAVSTTGTSGSSSSSSAASSQTSTSTTDLSAGTTAPSTAVTSSPSTPSIEGGPSGVGVFSRTPVRIYASVFGGYDDNVNTFLGNKQGSAFTGGNLILDYTFGDPRLQVILNGGAGGTYYLKDISSQNYDVDLKGALGINFKSSPRLTLGTTILVDYLTEPSFDNPGGLNSRNGNYFYTTDQFFATYAWTRRFATKTAYTLEGYQYDESSIGNFSNRLSNTFGNEFRFQLVPTTLLVAEYRYGIVSYSDSSLDSTTHFALAGLDHTFNPRFSTSLRGGAEFRSYDVDGKRTSPYFEGTLSYIVGRRVTVSWNNRYGIEEPEIIGAQSRTTFRTGLHGKLDVTSRVSATADIYYVHDDYHSLNTALVPLAPFSESTFDGGLSLHYAVTPLLGFQAGYHYTKISSDTGFREYSRNRVTGGVSLNF